MKRSVNAKSSPMDPSSREALPRVYGDTPTFLGVPLLKDPNALNRSDVVFMGVPWEGAVTWGGYSGCELAVKTVRHASARYGGYLPEYDMDFLEELTLWDAGDVRVCPGDSEATMEEIRSKTSGVFRRGAFPVLFGGDHSYTPDAVAALEENIGEDERIGILHLDSHMDNMPDYGGDPYARCSPLNRIFQISKVKKDAVVHMGIRGPRNAPLQVALAREAGSRIMTSLEIRQRGLASAMEEALERVHDGTQRVYLTICSDILDGLANPGGPPDFDGLMPHELFQLVHLAALKGLDGMDFVEIYPIQDPANRSSHLAVWTICHALAGLALRKGREE